MVVSPFLKFESLLRIVRKIRSCHDATLLFGRNSTDFEFEDLRVKQLRLVKYKRQPCRLFTDQISIDLLLFFYLLTPLSFELRLIYVLMLFSLVG